MSITTTEYFYYFFRIPINNYPINPLLSYLSCQAEVTYISKKPIYEISDYNHAMCKFSGDSISSNKYVQSFSTGKTELWENNINGNNIVIGIGDTGVDINHCMFHDSKSDVMYGTQINGNHRKILNYYNFMNRVEDDEYFINNISNGHGSHVCGIAAGSSETNPNSYTISFVIYLKS